MHVGLNLIYLMPGRTGGMETVARELIPALAAARPDVRLTAFVNREAAAEQGPWRDAADWVPCRCGRAAASTGFAGSRHCCRGLRRLPASTCFTRLARLRPCGGGFVEC